VVPASGPFREVPYMGVIYVVAEAAKRGFTNGHPDWCNLGQGQPEVGSLECAPSRIEVMHAVPGDHAYGPVGGTELMRQTVADHYNRLYRAGCRSKYTAANVAIAAGGRLALSRLLATLGSIRLGHQTPDYTAYEDMLAVHQHRVALVVVPTRAQEGFKISPRRFEQVLADERLDAYLVSNPNNPTGQLLEGWELAAWVDVARAKGCALLLDEFYSHFIYGSDGSPAPQPVSAARYVDDINHDLVLIVDGLTKNYRYPGWRIAWVIGPEQIVDQVARAASSIDGGPPMAVQRAACTVLESARADQETTAVRKVFARKRQIMLDALAKLGVRVPHPPRGTFYVWGDISTLPAPLNNAETFFQSSLERRVMVVPGRYFDVNPGAQRPRDADYERWVRFSFGPPEENMRLGLARLAAMLGR
jgi:aspartate/methionine/tyrosine aminotransferase